MGEMKSALDRALERAEALGKLSPEEMQQKKEGKQILIGKGLAERCLEHGQTYLVTEGISKYDGDEKAVIKRSTLTSLLQNIELENTELSTRAIQAILNLGRDERIERSCQKITDIIDNYHRTKEEYHQRKRAAIENSVMESLHQMRISGSAVGEINTGTGREWKNIVAHLHSQFDEHLGKLKESLSEALNLAPIA